MDPEIKKQEAEQAVPFTTAFDIAPIVKDTRKVQQETEVLREKEEQVFVEGSETEFWQLLKRKLQERQLALRSAGSLRLGTGSLNLQEIGMRAVIVNEIADGISDIINMVELPRKKRLAQIADKEEETRMGE